jgi:hypothetical protein
MINRSKIQDLEKRIFELEAKMGLMELSLNNLMLSQSMKINMDGGKWYQDSV